MDDGFRELRQSFDLRLVHLRPVVGDDVFDNGDLSLQGKLVFFQFQLFQVFQVVSDRVNEPPILPVKEGNAPVVRIGNHR